MSAHINVYMPPWLQIWVSKGGASTDDVDVLYFDPKRGQGWLGKTRDFVRCVGGGGREERLVSKRWGGWQVSGGWMGEG